MTHEVLEGGIVCIGKFVHLLVQSNVPQTIIFVSCDHRHEVSRNSTYVGVGAYGQLR